MDNFGYNVVSEKSVEQVSADLEKLSPEKGYRVLAIHDVKETLSGKGYEIKPLKIVEVCSADFAYKALMSDINVAMFMPCKIVVREDNDQTLMTLVRPSMISTMLPESGLEELAGEVEKHLIGLMDDVK